MQEQNPYLAPVGEAALAVESDAPSKAIDISSEYAGTPRRRLAAIVIDWFVMIPLSFLAGLVAVVVLSLQSRTPDEVALALASASLLQGLVTLVVYRTLCEWIAGATVGKLALGMRVRRAADFEPCGPGAALIRTLLFFFDSLLFGLPALWSMGKSPMKTRVGDNVAGTVVVRLAGIPPHARLSTGRTLLGIAVGMGAQVLLHAAILVC